MNLILKPFDVCYFRTSKPFSRETEHFAESIFPPFSTTVYGAIRTFIIEKNISFKDFNNENFDNNIKDIIGTKDKIGNLKIKGLFLSEQLNDGNKIYVNCPFDLRYNEKQEQFKILKLFKNENFISSSGLSFLPFVNDEEFESLENHYMSIESLNKYLCCDYSFENKYIKNLDEFIEKDIRTGIGIDNKTNIVKESQLYSVESIELKNDSRLTVVVNIENHINDKDIINLGGGHRKFSVKKENKNYFKNIDIKKIQTNIKENGKFKLLFLTPSIINKSQVNDDINNGWKLPEINKENILDLDGIQLKLISAIVNRPHKIGGFDMANKKPKPMYNVLQAGTIYYFEILDKVTDENIKKIFDKFYLKNNLHYSEQGFGLTIIGAM